MAVRQTQSVASPQARPHAFRFRCVRGLPSNKCHDPGLDAYLASFQAYHPLSKSEFHCLFKKFQKGNQQAAATIMYSHVRLVVRIAQTKRGRGLDMPDMVQEGLLGVKRALEKFDPAKKASFLTYASFWIEQSIERAVSEQGFKTGRRVPAHQLTLLGIVGRTQREFQNQHGRLPADHELWELVRTKPQKAIRGLSLKKIIELRRQLSDHKVSLDARCQQGREDTFESLMPAPQSDTEILVEARQRLAQCRRKIAKITESIHAHCNPRDARIWLERMDFEGRLEGRCGITLRDLGDKNGITRERVRQIEAKELRLVARRTGIPVSEILRLKATLEELERIVLSA